MNNGRSVSACLLIALAPLSASGGVTGLGGIYVLQNSSLVLDLDDKGRGVADGEEWQFVSDKRAVRTGDFGTRKISQDYLWRRDGKCIVVTPDKPAEDDGPHKNENREMRFIPAHHATGDWRMEKPWMVTWM